MTDDQSSSETTDSEGQGSLAPIPDALTAAVRPVESLGFAVVALLGMNILSELVGAWSNVMQIGLLEGMNAGVYTSEAALAANDERQQLIALFSLGAYLLTAVVFVAWMRRAYANLAAFDYQPKHGAGWAVGAWIVPFMNLIRPFQIMQEIHTISDPDRRFGDYVEPKSTGPMLFWWVSWLGMNMLGQITARWDADSVSALVVLTKILLISNAVGLCCAFLAILVVHTATTRQSATLLRLNGGASPATF